MSDSTIGGIGKGAGDISKTQKLGIGTGTGVDKIVKEIVKEDETKINTFGTTRVDLSKKALEQPVTEKQEMASVVKGKETDTKKPVDSSPTYLTEMDFVTGAGLLKSSSKVKAVGPNNIPTGASKLYSGICSLP